MIESLKSTFSPQPVENQEMLLNPLTVVFNLALLKYKEPQTKIGFSKNGVIYHDQSLLKRLERSTGGYKHEHLALLEGPIYMAVEWYPLEKYPDMEAIFNDAIEGLKEQLETYKTKKDCTTPTINGYINIFEQALGKRVKPEKPVDLTSSKIEEKGNPFEKKAREHWEDMDIKTIIDLFKRARTAKKTHSKKRALNTIEFYLSETDNAFHDSVIQSLSTWRPNEPVKH